MNLFDYLYRLIISKSYDDIDMALKNPLSVKKLNISLQDNINDYASDFLKFVNLQELYIQSDLSVETLPIEIGQLKTLEKLSTINVRFDVFPEWITDLVNLEYLMVRGCEITSVPKTIANLKKLKVLRIENCELAEMSEGINELTLLEELSFASTPILFSSLGNFPKSLKKLDLFPNMGGGRNGEISKNEEIGYAGVHSLFPDIEISPSIKVAKEKTFLEKLRTFIQH